MDNDYYTFDRALSNAQLGGDWTFSVQSYYNYFYGECCRGSLFVERSCGRVVSTTTTVHFMDDDVDEENLLHSLLRLHCNKAADYDDDCAKANNNKSIAAYYDGS